MALPHILRSITCALLLSAPLAFAPATCSADAKLPVIELSIGKHKIEAEVAASESQRATGLMNRFSLRQNQGMVFVFPSPQVVAMWMKNTYIPLSVAFIDSTGKILNIEDMEPQTLDSHPSAGDALYALEMRRGWFRERGIKPGTVINGLDKAGKAAN